MEQTVTLVSTGLEGTWPTRGRVILMGPWCRDNLHLSSRALELTEVPYHWNERAKIPRDLDEIDRHYEHLLPQVAETLNAALATSHTVRYWRILVGWWLYYFVQVLFDRWTVLMDSARAGTALRMIRLPSEGPLRPAMNSEEFMFVSVRDAWNERLWAELAERWTDIEVSSSRSLHGEPSDPLIVPSREQGTRVLARRMRTAAIAGYNRIASAQPLNRFGVAPYQEYVSLSTMVKLGWHLGTVPRIPSEHKFKSLWSVDPKMRQWDLVGLDGSDFSVALSALVPQLIPRVYLEGFWELGQSAAAIPLPRTSSVAYTANAYATNDTWKAWAADASERGTRLVIGQHGGGYGAMKWSATQRYELSIADAYLTWGWRTPDRRTIPAVASQLIGARQLVTLKKRRDLLLVGTTLPRYSFHLTSQPIAGQYDDYLRHQFALVENLSPETQSSLVVRPGRPDMGRRLADRWKEQFPRISLTQEAVSYRTALRRARLCVATYNGTCFLEAIRAGCPTVMYWDTNAFEPSADFARILDRLASVDVFFVDPVDCAEHINQIWPNPQLWWGSPEVRRAVHELSTKYANIGNRPLRTLAHRIRETPRD